MEAPPLRRIMRVLRNQVQLCRKSLSESWMSGSWLLRIKAQGRDQVAALLFGSGRGTRDEVAFADGGTTLRHRSRAANTGNNPGPRSSKQTGQYDQLTQSPLKM